MLSADEIICIVDENNVVVGSARREEMRRDRLIHRATYIFAKNSREEFYVQKRTMIKDYCPGYFDPVSGGVVQANESFEENAYRELEEEMGIHGQPLTHLFTFYFEDERTRCYGDAWEVVYDGELTLQEEEVDSVHMMTMEEIFRRAEEEGELFTPDGLEACRRYVAFKEEGN